MLSDFLARFGRIRYQYQHGIGLAGTSSWNAQRVLRMTASCASILTDA
jgi:hypothetical protein